MHPIFLNDFLIEVSVVEFAILHTVFKLLFSCFLQDVSEGIVRRYGYQNVQEFYKIYRKIHSAYAAYREQVAEWKKTYGEGSHKQDKGSILEHLKNSPERTANYQQQKTAKSKNRGAR